VASWDVTLTRSAVAEKVRNLADNIGQFQDMKPERIGQSGRVTQMRIIGSRRSVVVNGNRLRGALGLRDTLFTITRELNSDGSIASFTFHGRGWGHGVGLCQVGAFGMARAGHSYEEILKTYYPGVEIKKAYLADSRFGIRDSRLNTNHPNLESRISNLESNMDRLKSQILGIIVLALILLLLAGVRYYFKLG
jgi:peptidoglycan hydrolase-like amidase